MEEKSEYLKKCYICESYADNLCFECVNYYCDTCYKLVHEKKRFES